MKKTSYFAKPVESPSTYDDWGYFNVWGGFHYTTDPYAYFGLLRLWVKTLLKGQFKAARWVWNRMIWYRFRHRRCDTTDFHHQIYCLLDPISRKIDAQDRWYRVWTGKDAWSRYTEKDSAEL